MASLAQKQSPPTSALARRDAGFTLLEVVIALGIVAIGFLGAFAAVIQSGKLASAAEEDALAASGLEQRIDQLRELEWDELTNGAGLTTKVWTARPVAMAGITVAQETMTLSAYDIAGAKTLQGTWIGVSAPSVSFTAGAPDLSAASALRATATLTWTGRRSSRQQSRSLVTVIARGGISKSDL